MGFIISSGNGSGNGTVDSYTKTESDDKYATKTDLDSKANQTDLANKADTGVSYTKAESDNKYATTTALAGKANTGVSYTKAESDGKYATVKTRNIITAYPTTNYTLTQDEVYELIALDGNIRVGTAFSITTDDGILCSKAGVVSLSLKATYDTVSVAGVKWANAFLGTSVLPETTLSANSVYIDDTGTVFGTPLLVEVTAGEVIYLKVNGNFNDADNIGDVIKAGKEYTNITLEYID